MRVEFLPEATEEAEEAKRWYARRNAELGLEFEEAVAAAVAQIKAAHDRWPQYMHGTRRYLVRRFPYALIYIEERGVLHVVALAHLKRRPDYWRER